MSRTAQVNFVHQQGFPDAAPAACDLQYPALMFQPKLVGGLVVLGLVFQSGALFLVLSAVLFWSALLPAWNPFDALYNRLVARPRGRAELTAAPPPRRFAQGMAASFMLGIGACLELGWSGLALGLEALLVVALGALVLGKFCLGSYVFHLVRGNASFANRTLPWSRA
jgi:hypothetical protein